MTLWKQRVWNANINVIKEIHVAILFSALSALSAFSAAIHPSFLVPIVSDQPRDARGDRCRYEDRPYPSIVTAVASSITTKRYNRCNKRRKRKLGISSTTATIAVTQHHPRTAEEDDGHAQWRSVVDLGHFPTAAVGCGGGLVFICHFPSSSLHLQVSSGLGSGVLRW